MMMRIAVPAAFACAMLTPFLVVRRTCAQALPAGRPEAFSQGFELPHVAGTLRYSLRLTEGYTPSYSGGQDYLATAISGNVGYVSKSATTPFSLIVSSGYTTGTSGRQASPFFSAAASQVFRLKRWTFIASDSGSYLPEAPVVGLSGLAGLGDVGNAPIQVGNDLGDGLQSQYGSRFTNVISATASRVLTGKTTASFSAQRSDQHFTGGATTGIGNSSEAGTVSASHVIDARTQVSTNYSYSRFTYPQFNYTLQSQSAIFSYSRQLSRRMSLQVGAGPQSTSGAAVPSSVSYQADANFSYARDRTNFTASFVRSVNTGSGVTTASRANTVRIAASRKLNRYTSASVSVGYIKTEALPVLSAVQTRFSGDTLVSSFQLSRSVSRTLSTYGSYTLQRQLANQNTLGVNALNGVRQTISFGLTYSPRAITVGGQ